MIRQKIKGILVFTAIVAAGLWAAHQWVWPLLADPFIKLATLKREMLIDRTTVEALVVRSETVVRAPSGGTFYPDVGGGERVSRGARVGVVRGPAAEAAVCVPHAGLVFWDVDGLEEVLRAGAILPSDSVPVLRPSGPLADEMVGGGEPLCRVADNLSPVMLHFYVPPGVLPRSMLREGEYWRVFLDEREYTGRVTTVFPDNEAYGAELRLSRYPDTLLRDRRVSCAVVTREMTGFIVPRAAIVLRAGNSGIYLLCKDRIKWRPVRVEGQLGGSVQISGDALTEGGRYVVNPWAAADGRSYLRDK